MLFEADQDLARLLVRREKIDHKIARLQAVICELQNLCYESHRKQFQKRVDAVIKADRAKGITELSRAILQEKLFPMTASELRKAMEARKLDLSVYSNPLAVIHTILKRLVKGGEVKVIPKENGQKAYQWIRTAEKLLAELQQTGRTTIGVRADPRESQ